MDIRTSIIWILKSITPGGAGQQVRQFRIIPTFYGFGNMIPLKWSKGQLICVKSPPSIWIEPEWISSCRLLQVKPAECWSISMDGIGWHGPPPVGSKINIRLVNMRSNQGKLYLAIEDDLDCVKVRCIDINWRSASFEIIVVSDVHINHFCISSMGVRRLL